VSFLQFVRSRIEPSTQARHCSKQGCKVPLKDVPQPRLVLDLDRPDSPFGQSEVRCDYLIVGESDDQTGWAVALELKRGKVSAEVANQLQAGAKIMETLMPREANVDFTPVVAGRGFHSNVKKTLAKRRIRFQQRQTAIVLISCGKPLANAVSF